MTRGAATPYLCSQTLEHHRVGCPPLRCHKLYSTLVCNEYSQIQDTTRHALFTLMPDPVSPFASTVTPLGLLLPKECRHCSGQNPFPPVLVGHNRTNA